MPQQTRTPNQAQEKPTLTSSFEGSSSTAGKALAKAVNYLIKDLNWSNSEFAKLLHLKSRTINDWLKKGCIPVARGTQSPDIQAILHAVGIHRSLTAMFSDSKLKQEWINTKHPDFNDTPKNVIAESIDGLIFTRRYLDYVRGRGA